MRTRLTMKGGLVRWFAVLGLSIAGLCGFAERVSAADDPPKPLPEDLIASWKKGLSTCIECWMYQDELGRLKEPDRLEKPKAGYVPALRIITDEVSEGTLAKLPAPEVPFGISCQSAASRRNEKAFPDYLLKELAGMKNLRFLTLEERKVTEAGLKELAAAKNLQTLSLNNCTEVTDGVLKDLAGIEGLKTLLIKRCGKVTDAGMKEIAKMKNLEVLTIEFTKVTDAGLKDLSGLKSLRLIYTNGSGVTPTGIASLQKALPNCTINK